MKRILGTINRKGSIRPQTHSRSAQNATQDVVSVDDSPEANVTRGVKLFCESGGPNNSGEEVLHLPVIVEAAESSPAAAHEAAHLIRKFLSKDNFQRAYVQYNAIMLVRILTDNPGKSFTKNLDAKFAATVKDLLRDGRDMSVQQILRETLESFEVQKSDEETLAPLREMWKKEKQRIEKFGGAAVTGPIYTPLPPVPNQQNYFARNHRPHGLPPPHELAQRVEEARTSSKLLLQVVQSTPPTELIGNELVKEFVERCQSASRSVQGYIHSTNPPPDEDTLLTLIETNDQLSTAISRHQRALLQARRVTGAANNNIASPPSLPPSGLSGGLSEVPGSQPRGGMPIVQPLFSLPPDHPPPPQPPPSQQQQQLNTQARLQDPFNDHQHPDMSRASPDNMQAPLEPQHYGGSAFFRQQQQQQQTNSQAAAPPNNSAYTHTDFQPMSPYDGQQNYNYNYAGNHPYQMTHGPAATTGTNEAAVSPEEVRQPVQYRF